jgi:hypothetical protein
LSTAVRVAALVQAPGSAVGAASWLWTTTVLPDIALLYGIAAAPDFERLPSYAVRPYNVLHPPAIPATLPAFAAST